MIHDSINNFALYSGMHKHFPDVALFLETSPVADRADGKYEINDEGAFAIIETYPTQDLSDCFIECHRKHIDVQLLIEGIEQIGVCHKSTCKELPYDEEKDFQKLEGDVDMLTLRAGSFMIFYPEDGHMPKVKCGNDAATVKKIVFKVPI